MAAIASERARLLPRWTVRLRLTLLYGALFLAAGAVLLAITYGLVANSISGAAPGRQVFISPPGGRNTSLQLPAVPEGLPKPAAGQSVFFSARTPKGEVRVQLRGYAGRVKSAAAATIRRLTSAQRAQIEQLAAKANARLAHQHDATLNTLLTRSGIALGIMAFLSIGLGWLMAGRALRPVRTMSARARGISERNLHERLALDGPDDELKELGATFDGLLGRLETAFESQRRFVANASHELRTPITVERTLVEVALADPDADLQTLRATCERVLTASEQQERLIESLLTLARSQRGLDSREEVDLSTVALDIVEGTAWNGVRVQSSLAQARVSGDPALVERLVGNLVENARLHNLASGWVRVWTGLSGSSPTIRVANTGPVIAPDEVASLAEPFRRLNGHRVGVRGGEGGGERGGDGVGEREGLGLGLSIVDAIARAHGASLTAAAREGGGLEVEVRFPG